MGSVPGQERFHMLRSNQDHVATSRGRLPWQRTSGTAPETKSTRSRMADIAHFPQKSYGADGTLTFEYDGAQFTVAADGKCSVTREGLTRSAVRRDFFDDKRSSTDSETVG